MQIRVIKHVRKVYGCRDCETAPVTADKPAQLIEKSMASPSVLAMLLTTKAGYLPIDNNAGARAIRPFVIGRNYPQSEIMLSSPVPGFVIA
jgi:hypothetical protein